jgi:hypothetical protein
VGSSSPAAFAIVASATPNGQYVATELEDAQGTFTLTPAPNNGFNPAIDATITLPAFSGGVLLPGSVTAPLLVGAAFPAGDGSALQDDDPTASPPTPSSNALVAAPDVGEIAAAGVRQPAIHTNDAMSHLLVGGSFAFSFASAAAVSPLLGFSVSGGQRLVNAYLQALARGILNNAPSDFVPYAWTLTDTFSRVFAGALARPAASPARENSMDGGTWEETTGDLDWQRGVATATAKASLPTDAAPRKSAATQQQQQVTTPANDEYFAGMAASTDDYLAEDD